MPPKAAAAAKTTTKAPKAPRTSKNAKLAETLDAVIEMLNKEKPPVSKIVSKLESVKNKLAGNKKKGSGTLSPYQAYVKKHMHDKELEGKDAPQKMKAIAAMWKKDPSNPKKA